MIWRWNACVRYLRYARGFAPATANSGDLGFGHTGLEFGHPGINWGSFGNGWITLGSLESLVSDLGG